MLLIKLGILAPAAVTNAGRVIDTEWDDSNIGQYSTAMGNITIASGLASVAMGNRATASAQYSTAIGSYTTASGVASTAMGSGSIASAQTSTAMGNVSTASGFTSIAMGYNTVASGFASIAMGYNTTASGGNSTAIGSFVSTNALSGALIIGDYNNITSIPVLNSTLANQMTTRFVNGYRFFTNAATTQGLTIAPTTGIASFIAAPADYTSTTFSDNKMLVPKGYVDLKVSGLTSKVLSDQTGSYTLALIDNGKIITINSASAVNLTIPALAAGFNCMVVQTGAGAVTFTISGTTISNRNGFTKTSGINAVATIIALTSTSFITSGDMQ